MTEHDPRRPGEEADRPRSEAELLELIQGIDEPAPQRLHERVQAMVDEATRSQAGGRARSRSRLFGWGSRRFGRDSRRFGRGSRRFGWAATAVACVAAALALALSGASSPAPTLAEASALTLRGPSMAAPSESTARRGSLTAAVDGVAFPYWEHRFGWRATGQRIDTIDGRTIRTVFYTSPSGLRVGYAIVAGRPAPNIATGSVSRRHGTAYRLTAEHGASVITWQRDGHLCIVSGRGVDAATLLALASWDERGRLS